MTDLHMIILAWVREHQVAFSDEVADALGLDARIVAALFADLEAFGLITPVARH